MFEIPQDNFRRRLLVAEEVVFLENQEADISYVILQGHVDIVIRDPSGADISVDRLGPGELFGEIALLHESHKRTATVIAADNCELLEIDQNIFESRLKKADPLVRFVLDHLTRRLMNTTQRYITERAAR